MVFRRIESCTVYKTYEVKVTDLLVNDFNTFYSNILGKSYNPLTLEQMETAINDIYKTGNGSYLLNIKYQGTNLYSMIEDYLANLIYSNKVSQDYDEDSYDCTDLVV